MHQHGVIKRIMATLQPLPSVLAVRQPCTDFWASALVRSCTSPRPAPPRLSARAPASLPEKLGPLSLHNSDAIAPARARTANDLPVTLALKNPWPEGRISEIGGFSFKRNENQCFRAITDKKNHQDRIHIITGTALPDRHRTALTVKNLPLCGACDSVLRLT